MTALFACVVPIAAAGMLCAIAETLLPRSGSRTAARTAIGLLFFAFFAEKITGIFR